MGGSRCGIGVEDEMKFLDCYGCELCRCEAWTCYVQI